MPDLTRQRHRLIIEQIGALAMTLAPVDRDLPAHLVIAALTARLQHSAASRDLLLRIAGTALLAIEDIDIRRKQAHSRALPESPRA